MTTPPFQPQPQQPNPPPPPTKKKHGPSFWILIALGVIVLIIFVGCTAALLNGVSQGVKELSSASPSESQTSETETVPRETSAAPATTAPTKKGYSPKKTDFAIKIKTTSKHCFGSGFGCNLEIKVSPLRTLPRSSFPSSGEIEISYVIKGGEDGPLEDTLVVYLDDNTTDTDDQFLSTRNKSVKLTAAVTDVEYNP